MSCCEPAKWKREEIADHKFDYVDVDDFVEDSPTAKFSYSFVFMFTLKSILVYMADLGVLVLLLQSGAITSLFDQANNPASVNGITSTPSGNALFCDGTTEPSSAAGQWVKSNPHIIIGVIAASIALSFILLFFEWRKAMAIIRSRDISYAFTSTVAYRYYTIRSFPHYCFFSQIQNSRKTTDIVAFFVFFRFKGWKRLLLAEFPRQFLNAISILVTLDSCTKKDFRNDFLIFKLGKAYGSAMQLSGAEYSTKKATLILSTITVTVWIVSALSLLLAFFMYIPLLCTIRGIGELLRRKSRKRIQEARKAEIKEIEASRHRQINGGDGKATPPAGLSLRPTLPDIDVDLDSTYARSQSRSTFRNAPSGVSNPYSDPYGGAQYQMSPAPRIGYGPALGPGGVPMTYSSHAPSIQHQSPPQYPRSRGGSEYAYQPPPSAGPYGGGVSQPPTFATQSDCDGSEYGGGGPPSQYGGGSQYGGASQYQPQSRYDVYAMTPSGRAPSQPYYPSSSRSASSNGDHHQAHMGGYHR
ncbi:hypothetical protein BASA61_008600 [Batrachochytrium salamandrivorans]|nr:hypothetical protein BASA61_008600 [Batrachochytrium salamandrivorans]